MIRSRLFPRCIAPTLTAFALAAVLSPAASLAQTIGTVTPVGPAIAIRPVPVPPDLVVSGFTINNFPISTTTPCAPGQPRFNFGACGNPQFTVTVTNNGPGFATGNTGVHVSINGVWATGNALNLTNLAPGASVNVNVGSYLGPCDTICNGWATSYSFSARVDPTNVIAETNEGNNVWAGAPLLGCRHCP